MKLLLKILPFITAKRNKNYKENRYSPTPPSQKKTFKVLKFLSKQRSNCPPRTKPLKTKNISTAKTDINSNISEFILEIKKNVALQLTKLQLIATYLGKLTL